MWNCLDLKCPVDDVCEYGLQNGSVLRDLPNLVSLLTSSAEVLTEDHPIWTEIKLFENVQMKYKRILHCDKCLHLLQRVGGCLRKMVLLDLSRSFLDLAEQLLIGLQSQNTKIILPSRQQLEYILIRTQTAAKLICEALHYSRETFCYLIQRLRVGHMILNLMMATSVTARVNILFKGILIQIFDFYRQIFSWCKKLKRGTHEWPQPLNLPEDLESWLKPEESELLKPKHVPKEQLDFLTHFFEKNQNTGLSSQDADTDSVVEIVSEDENPQAVVDDNVSEQNNDFTQDIGELIERTYMHETQENAIKSSLTLTKPQKVLLMKIKQATTLKSLRIIWNNLDVSSSDLLPKALTPKKIRLIDKMFEQIKHRIVQAKKLPPEKKQKDIAFVMQLATRKLANHLGLVEKEETSSPSANESFEQLKPVKTFKELKKMYKTLYHMLQVSQQYDKCHKLKKVFKSRKQDIKLLIQNQEKITARKLIFCTSKVFLTRYKC